MKHHLKDFQKIIEKAWKWDAFIETEKTEKFFSSAISVLEELRKASFASDFSAMQRILNEFFEEQDKLITEEIIEE